MINYLPYIFGISSLLLGIYLFLVYFEIYKPKKSTEETKEKSENFKTMMKIFSIILILNGGSDLLHPNPERYKISHNHTENNAEWTADSRDILIETCLRDSGVMPKKYPSIMEEYAECSTDKIMIAFNRKEYLEISSKSMEEQEKILIPLIKNCLAEMNRKVDSVEQNKIKNIR